MGDINNAVAAWGGLGGFAAALAILGPLRGVWRKGYNRRLIHRLDHEGRPARIDPSTGRVIEAAQPGIASMIGDMHTRQIEIGTKVDTLADNAQALAEIRQLLKDKQLIDDARHNEIKRENAETREQVSELRNMAREAATQARDAAGHAARIDRQQQEMAAHQQDLATQVQTEFEHQRAWTGAYVTALGDMGVQVTPPEQSTAAPPR